MYISYYAFGTYVGQKSEGGLCTNMYSGLSVWFLLRSMWMGLFWKTYLLVKQHDNSPTSIIEKPSSWRKRSDKTMAPLPPGYWNCYLISLSALFFQKKKSLGAGCPWHPAQYYRPRNSILHRSSSAIQKHPWPQFVGFVGFWASPSCRRVQPHPVEKSCSTKWVCKRFPPRFRIY